MQHPELLDDLLYIFTELQAFAGKPSGNFGFGITGYRNTAW